MRLADQTAARRRISLTPLIDVVFLLLIFFMLASSFSRFTLIEIKAGDVSAVSVAPDQNNLLVLHPSGDFSYRGSRQEPGLLISRLEREGTTGQHWLVRASEGVRVQGLVDALARLKAAGIADITVLRQPAPVHGP